MGQSPWGCTPTLPVTAWAPPPRRPATGDALAIVAIAALLPIADLALVHLYRGSFGILAVALCSAVIFGLLCVRVAALARALDRTARAVARAASREQVLTRAALTMVAADDARAVAEATVWAATSSDSLGDPWSLFVVTGAHGPRIAAAAGAKAPRTLDADIVSLWDRHDVLARQIHLLERNGRSGLRVRFVAPVTVAMSLRAFVVVGNVHTGTVEFAPALAMLASQAALALHAIDWIEERRLAPEQLSPSMHEAAVRRLAVAADLRDALVRDQLEVFYQPIVNISSGSLVGAEALVRWNHPRRGRVEPDEFIPVAEETGLVVPLDRFVLTQACMQTQTWRTQRSADEAFCISVNLSGCQLRDSSIVDDVDRALRKSQLPATSLVLEVTESAVMDDVERAAARLRELKALGLRLALDDFGTGHSSLSRLSHLPVDIVKIDKSFIDRLTDDPDGKAMVRVVLDLSQTLGLVVVAEGIETEDQLNLLGAMGCSSAQGYLLGKPMPAGDMTRVFDRARDGQLLHRPIGAESHMGTAPPQVPGRECRYEGKPFD